jgi:hypothetical protein
MEDAHMNLEMKINEVRTRLARTEKAQDGKVIASRLYDETIADIESLLSQNTIRRPELSGRLGISLLELTHLEEDIFQLRKRQEEQRRRQESEVEPEILESVQFQAVSIRPDQEDSFPVPAEAQFSDSRTWIRIISMTGFKIELNSLPQAVEILKIVLQAHRKA